MAKSIKKSIKKSPAKKNKKEKLKTAKADASPSVDPSPELHTVRTLRAKYAPPTDAERAEFDEHATNDKRSELGKQTLAADVFAELTRNAVEIDDAYTKYGAAVVAEYPKPRFRYFLDWLETLGTRIDEAARDESAKKAAKSSGVSVFDLAKEARAKLIRKLRRFAKHRSQDKLALQSAMGLSETPAAVTSSLLALVVLAREWLAGRPAALVASAGLTSAVVDAAERAMKALTTGASGAALAGRRGSNDAPLVNLAEGGALIELDAANDAFIDLYDETGVVPKLRLGKSARRVLEAHVRQAEPAVAPTPPTSPVGGAPEAASS